MRYMLHHLDRRDDLLHADPTIYTIDGDTDGPEPLVLDARSSTLLTLPLPPGERLDLVRGSPWSDRRDEVQLVGRCWRGQRHRCWPSTTTRAP